MISKVINFILIIFIFFFMAPGVLAQEKTIEGVITKIIEEDGNYQKLEITSNNQKLIIENGLFETSQNIKYKVNDKVVVTDGIITDYVRRPALIY